MFEGVLLVAACDLEQLAAQHRRRRVAHRPLDRTRPTVCAAAVPKALHQRTHTYIKAIVGSKLQRLLGEVSHLTYEI